MSVALFAIISVQAFGQSVQGLTVTNYQFVSEERVTRNESLVTYRADLVNTGPARPVTAAALSTSASYMRAVEGSTNLRFPAVPANGRVTSLNTFTLYVDRTATFSFNDVRWTFGLPVADAGPNQSVSAGARVSLDGSRSTDPFGFGGLAYRWSFVSRPPGTSTVLQGFDSVMAAFTADVTGTYLMMLTVSNPNGFDYAFTTISVGNRANSAPVADAGANQTVPVTTAVTLNGSRSSDVDGDPLTYLWTLTTRPTGSNAVLAGANTVMPTFTADKAGTYMARLVVNDGKVDSAPATVQITTSNTPPVANAGPNQTVSVGATVQLTGAASTDIDGDPLTYQWSLNAVPAGSTASLANPTTVNPTFVADRAGNYVVQLVVSDGRATSTATVTISTSGGGTPTANAGPNQTVKHGETVTLRGSGTDPGNLPLTFQWSLTTKPTDSTATLSNATIATPTFVADKPGIYVAQLRVSNGTQTSAPATVTITTTNTPPVANAGPAQTVGVGAIVSLNGGASTDADGDALNYTWSFTSRPAGSNTTLSAANSRTPTFLADVAGTYVVQLIVNDGFANSDPPSTVTITAVPGGIALPGGLSLGLGQSAQFAITLASPAPGNGVTITLSANNQNISFTAPQCPTSPCVPNLTSQVTVFVPGGSRTPEQGRQPTIHGYAPGSTSITASASGFTSVSTQVQVTASFSFTPSSLTIVGTEVKHSFLVLSGPAPAPPTGIVTTLTSGNPSVALVPATITFFWDGSNTTALNIPITGVGAGTTVIRASAPGLTDALLNVTVVGATTITTTSLPPAVQGVAYNTTVVASGGTPPYTWSATGLPTGLSINASTGAITGTPTSVGPANVVISVSDSSTPRQTDTKTLSLTIQGPFRIATASFPDGRVGTAYNLTLGAVGGTTPYSWSATGLPAGMNIDASTGVVSGTPSQAGTASVNLTVTDSTSPSRLTATLTLPLRVVGPLSITTTSLPSGAVGVAYSVTPSAVGGATPYTWSATGLPPGLTINGSSGNISGNPTTVGAHTVALTVTDSTNPVQTVTVNLPLAVGQPLAITTTSLPSGVLNSPYSGTVTATGGVAPYAWSATNLPTGLSINPTTGAITGSPTVTGTTTAVVTVQDATSPNRLSATANLSITVVAPLTITTSSLPAGAVGTPYNTLVTVTGGATPYAWTATGLPAGLAINGSTGAITGTPTTAGTSTVNISVQDATSPTRLSASVSLPVTIVSQLSITTTSLPGGTAGTAYSAGLSAAGGVAPYTWSATGLPAGLSINATTGAISGTPSAAGTSTVTINVQDSATPTRQNASTSLSIVIAQSLTITTTSLPNGATGAGYSASLAATGGATPYTWTATGLPAGLSINSATGAITGTPTTAGSSTVNVTVEDSTSPTKQTASRSFPVTISQGLSITTTSLPGGTTGLPYSATVAATGGTAPYTWSASGLPAGLTINGTTGVIGGTPTAGGTSTVVVTVQDSTSPSRQSATSSLSLPIAVGLSITTTALPGGTRGLPYNATLAATGGTTPYTWSATGLPAGLSINTSTGAISGTPTVAGTVTVQITVQDSTSPSRQSATAGLSLTIVAPALTITTNALANGTVGTPYAATLTATGGTLPYSWSATGLPAGLSLNAAGQISGTPTTAGTSTVSITVLDQGTPRLSAMTNLPLVIQAGGGNVQLSLTSTSVGKDLVSSVRVSIPAALLTDSLVTLRSGNVNIVGLGANGIESVQFPIPAGQTSASVFVQSRGGVGTSTLTASGAGFIDATGTVTVTPSGFVLAGPSDVGVPSFPTVQNEGTTLTVFAARLDTSGRYVEKQPVRPSLASPITVNVTSTSGGTVNPASLIFQGGDQSQGFLFRPVNTGNITITAQTPSGFTPPIDGTNVLTANVASIGLTPDSVTVGRNLAAPARVALSGAAPAGGLRLTITSNSTTRLKFSTTPTGVGLDSIELILLQNARQSPEFYVYGLDSTGTATYTASAVGFGSASGTVTFAPSALVFANSGGGPPDPILTTPNSAPTTIAVYSVALTGSGGLLASQPIAGGLSASATVSLDNSSVGVISPATVTISGGSLSTITTFDPGTSGTATISISVPASPPGFSAPAAAFRTIAVNNRVPGVSCPDFEAIGNNLQIQATCSLGEPTTTTTRFTISGANSLRFSQSRTSAGVPSLQVDVPAGQSGFTIYLQAIDSAGTANYTVSAPGYSTFTSTNMTTTPSAVVGDVFNLGFFVVGVGSTATVNVSTAQLDSFGGFARKQELRGGFSITVPIVSANAGVAAVVTSPVTISGGVPVESQGTTSVRGVAAGGTTISLTQPAGFTATPPSFQPSSTLQVSVN